MVSQSGPELEADLHCPQVLHLEDQSALASGSPCHPTVNHHQTLQNFIFNLITKLEIHSWSSASPRSSTFT